MKYNFQNTFRINNWLVKPDKNEISSQDKTIRLDHKVMQLLVFFAQNSGKDLPKNEILKGVWGEGVFADEVLTVAVSSLRKALGDDPRSPKYIKTIPRFGYRMLTQISEQTPTGQKGNFLEFLDERIGLRFLLIGVIIILFFLVLLTRDHTHF